MLMHENWRSGKKPSAWRSYPERRGAQELELVENRGFRPLWEWQTIMFFGYLQNDRDLESQGPTRRASINSVPCAGDFERSFSESSSNSPEELKSLVGTTGFEPATSASRTQRSTRLSHVPTVVSF
jgi:hypothetical protein